MGGGLRGSVEVGLGVWLLGQSGFGGDGAVELKGLRMEFG